MGGVGHGFGCRRRPDCQKFPLALLWAVAVATASLKFNLGIITGRFYFPMAGFAALRRWDSEDHFADLLLLVCRPLSPFSRTMTKPGCGSGDSGLKGPGFAPSGVLSRPGFGPGVVVAVPRPYHGPWGGGGGGGGGAQVRSRVWGGGGAPGSHRGPGWWWRCPGLVVGLGWWWRCPGLITGLGWWPW